MDIEQRKEAIQKLEKELGREAKRIVRAGERSLSDEYTETVDKLKKAKTNYETEFGRPYTPPELKPSQVDSTLFIRPRTRTASSEPSSDTCDTPKKPEAKLS